MLTDLAVNAPDVLLTGAQARTQFGWRLLSLHLNGDGIDDLAVSANGFAHAGSAVGVGAVSVFLGSRAWPITWDTSAMPEDLKIVGTPCNENFGHCLAAGDFNVDGLEDLAAQSISPDDLDPRFQAGIVRLFFGRALLPAAWDLRTKHADVTITGAGRADLLGGTVALDAGDLDGDGNADLVASAPELGRSPRRTRCCSRDWTREWTRGTIRTTRRSRG